MRSGSTGANELAVSLATLAQLPQEATPAGAAPTVPGTQQTQIPILFCCGYKVVSLLMKAEPNVRGKGEELLLWLMQTSESCPAVDTIELSLIFPFSELSHSENQRPWIPVLH